MVPVIIESPGGELAGGLTVPTQPVGIVVFADGSGSSRHSKRNRAVVEVLQRDGFATLLLDLLTEDEEQVDSHTRQLRFDMESGTKGGRQVVGRAELGVSVGRAGSPTAHWSTLRITSHTSQRTRSPW
jgi:putative phosphoribosyl transferase